MTDGSGKEWERPDEMAEAPGGTGTRGCGVGRDGKLDSAAVSTIVRLAVLATVSCAMRPSSAGAQLTADDRAALADLGPQFAVELQLIRGWYRGTAVSYYDIGPQAPTIAPVFFAVTGFAPDGSPLLVPGQRPIVAVLPGQRGYSAIMQVHYFVVPPDYVANSLRDAREVVALSLRGQVRLVIPGNFVNYPIVPRGSVLAGDPAARPLLTAWFKGEEVPYWDFGRTGPAPAPIFTFLTGFEGGEPQFLRAQANVLDVVPGTGAEYRDMWEVHFVLPGAGYTADSLRSLTELERERAAGRLTVRRTGTTRNCPVVAEGGAVIFRPGLASAARGEW